MQGRHLQICLSICTMSGFSFLQIQFDDTVGYLGSNDTTLQCAFTKNDYEIVLFLTLSARNHSTGVYDQIAFFLPNQDGKLTTSGQYLSGKIKLSSLTSYSTDITLIFRYLDCDMETSYGCKIQFLSSSRGQELEEQHMNLSVAVNPSIPKIVLDTFPVPEGGIVTFTCTGNTGKPQTPFVWQKQMEDSKQVTYRNVSTTWTYEEESCSYIGSSTLSIEVTSYDNNAVVRCSVNNSNEDIYFNETRPLNVLYKVRKPSIIRKPMADEYLQGLGLIIVTCSSTGNPPPVYKWFKDGQEDLLPSCGNRLFITDITANNSGVYRCNVTNTVSGVEYSESTAVNIVIMSAKSDASITTVATVQNQDKSESIEGIVFGVIAAVLLVTLIIVVIVFWNINERIKLKHNKNYDDLRLRGPPGQFSQNDHYDGIILHNQSDISPYENAEQTREDSEHSRSYEQYEYAYVNPVV